MISTEPAPVVQPARVFTVDVDHVTGADADCVTGVDVVCVTGADVIRAPAVLPVARQADLPPPPFMAHHGSLRLQTWET